MGSYDQTLIISLRKPIDINNVKWESGSAMASTFWRVEYDLNETELEAIEFHDNLKLDKWFRFLISGKHAGRITLTEFSSSNACVTWLLGNPQKNQRLYFAIVRFEEKCSLFFCDESSSEYRSKYSKDPFHVEEKTRIEFCHGQFAEFIVDQRQQRAWRTRVAFYKLSA